MRVGVRPCNRGRYERMKDKENNYLQIISVVKKQ
jgi:hypothetical protein